jgi:hypothetical protein
LFVLANKIQPCTVKLETTPDGKDLLPKFKCLYCAKFLKNTNMVKYHVRNQHVKVGIRCPIRYCVSFFKTTQEREKHITEVHDKSKKSSFCKVCGAFLLNWKSAWSHMKTRHKNFIRCSYKVCTLYFKTSDEQKQHIQQVHAQENINLQCLYCGIWCSKRYLVPHVKIKHKDIALQCTKVNCILYFKTESERQEHLEKVHLAERKKKKQSCFYCGKIYPTTSLSGHINLMHSKISIKCSIFKCKSYFHTKKELEKHFKERHEEAEKQKKLHCAHCSYKTNKKPSFIQHFNYMHGTEKLRCSRCPKNAQGGKYYKSKNALEIHTKKVHSGLETCQHCMQKITNKAVMKAHSVSDVCNRCDKKYLCVGLMKMHQKKCKPAKK